MADAVPADRGGFTPGLEEIEDVLLEGDAPVRAGVARAALRHRPFAILWSGTLASNVGTWMQNVALGALAFRLSHSAGFVALVGFAQLGPVLALAVVGGVLADTYDRRMLIVVTNVWMLVFSTVLAWVAHANHPSETLIVVTVLAVGMGNALWGPPQSSLLPTLVDRDEIIGAVSLMSVQLNVARVVGPAIGGLILPAVHPWGIFAINAVTYLFAVAAALAVPKTPATGSGAGAVRSRLLAGFAVARRDPLVGRALVTITLFSFACLPFLGLMPVIAGINLGMSTRGLAYGVLYACFGAGAAAGALGVGTVFARADRLAMARWSLAAFAVALAAFGALRSAGPAYPVAFLLGLAYFATTTGVLSALQEHLADETRGRVMALWMMGFGGVVPLGLIVFGKVADVLARSGHATAATLTAVLSFGAAAAAVMAAADVMGSRRPAQRPPLSSPSAS